jgi:hypothetical protein
MALTTSMAVNVLELEAKKAELTPTTVNGLRSSFVDAVRQAHRRADGTRPTAADVADIEIQDKMDLLPVLGREAAIERRHQSPGEHERRVVRAVELITGERYDLGGPKRAMPMPPAWAPLADVLLSLVGNGKSEIRFLAQCATLVGREGEAPAELPTYAELVEGATKYYNGDVERAKTRLAQAATVYRRARRLLMDLPGADQAALRRSIAFLSPLPVGRATHLGVEPDTYSMLDAKGLVAEEMSPADMFRALFPALAEDYDTWLARTDSGINATATTRDLCFQTLLRLAGWLIRAGHIDVIVPLLDDPSRSEVRPLRSLLSELHLDGLFAVSVEVAGSCAGVSGRQARRRGQRQKAVQRCLLAHLIEQEAPASLARSTVIDDSVDTTTLTGAGGLFYFTDAIRTNCERIWSMTEPVWQPELLNGDAADKGRWALIKVCWEALKTDVQSRKKGRALPPEHRKLAKNKKKLIRTITLPQLQCVGMPLRRREIRRSGEEWEIAREKAIAAKHPDPDAHPAVVDAAERYFDEGLVPHLMLSIVLEDGLRKKQYVRGRPGLHFDISLDVDADGNPTGVAGMRTNWTADKMDPAHLKNWETNAEGRLDREVRFGFVDPDFLWRFLSVKRPRDLVAGGAVASLSGYDLRSDLRSSDWAFFATTSAPSAVIGGARRNKGRPDRSRTDLADKIGEELYRVARLLRPELKQPWEEMRCDPTWRSLWAPHIARLLIASYWGGVRDDWDTAVYLTTDQRSTLEGEYAIVAADIKERTGRQITHWEHPKAYDAWMDRMYYDREVFDPLDDETLPLPPHLVGQIASERARTAAERKRMARKHRIRRARPGQARPRSGS